MPESAIVDSSTLIALEKIGLLEIDRTYENAGNNIMKIKEEAVKELNGLQPADLLVVYDLILSLKKNVSAPQVAGAVPGHVRAREALRKCVGSFSEDLLRAREDRI